MKNVVAFDLFLIKCDCTLVATLWLQVLVNQSKLGSRKVRSGELLLEVDGNDVSMFSPAAIRPLIVGDHGIACVSAVIG